MPEGQRAQRAPGPAGGVGPAAREASRSPAARRAAAQFLVPAFGEPAGRLLAEQAHQVAHPAHDERVDGDEGDETPAQGPFGAAGGPGAGDPVRHLGDQELEDGGGGRVHRDPPVPVAQQGGQRGEAGVAGRGVEDDVAHLLPGLGEAVHLQGQRGRHVPVGAGGERLGDAGHPVAVEEVAAQVGAGRRGQVVGGGHVAGGGVGQVRQVGEGDGVGLPPRRLVPGGQRQGTRPAPAHRRGADQLPADAAPGVGVGDVQRHRVPSGEGAPQVLGGAGPAQLEQGAQGAGHQPGGRHRQVPHLSEEGGTYQRAAVGDQHLDHLGLPAAHLDHLGAHLTGDEAIAAPHAGAVGADLLYEEVGVVDQSGRHPPGEVAVVGGGHRRGAGERGAGQRPLRGGDVEQVPVRGEHGGQVRVVGQHRAPGTGARRGDGPVVGGAPQADGRGQEGGVVGQPVGGPPGRLAGPVAGRLPLRVGRVEGGQSLGAVEGEDLEPGQLHVPVGGHGEGEQGHVAEGVGRPIGGGMGPQEGELVRAAPQAHGAAHGHARGRRPRPGGGARARAPPPPPRRSGRTRCGRRGGRGGARPARAGRPGCPARCGGGSRSGRCGPARGRSPPRTRRRRRRRPRCGGCRSGRAGFRRGRRRLRPSGFPRRWGGASPPLAGPVWAG